MGDWVVWSEAVGAMSGAVGWEHKADWDGDGCGEMVIVEL